MLPRLGDFSRRKLFAPGARDVIPLFYDEKLARTRLIMLDIAEYKNVPEWMAGASGIIMLRKGCVSISVISEDPEIFAGAVGKKLMAGTVAKKKSFKEFYDAIDRGDLRWTIVAYPCEAWAHKMFPELSVKRAVNQLWNAIFRSVRITQGDTLKKWQRHDLRLKKRADYLNRSKFSALEFRSGLGTDLTVGITGRPYLVRRQRNVDGWPEIFSQYADRGSFHNAPPRKGRWKGIRIPAAFLSGASD